MNYYGPPYYNNLVMADYTVFWSCSSLMLVKLILRVQIILTYSKILRLKFAKINIAKIVKMS
jgi:hypothetical protein